MMPSRTSTVRIGARVSFATISNVLSSDWLHLMLRNQNSLAFIALMIVMRNMTVSKTKIAMKAGVIEPGPIAAIVWPVQPVVLHDGCVSPIMPCSSSYKVGELLTVIGVYLHCLTVSGNCRTKRFNLQCTNM